MGVRAVVPVIVLVFNAIGVSPGVSNAKDRMFRRCTVDPGEIVVVNEVSVMGCNGVFNGGK